MTPDDIRKWLYEALQQLKGIDSVVLRLRQDEQSCAVELDKLLAENPSGRSKDEDWCARNGRLQDSFERIRNDLGRAERLELRLQTMVQTLSGAYLSLRPPVESNRCRDMRIGEVRGMSSELHLKCTESGIRTLGQLESYGRGDFSGLPGASKEIVVQADEVLMAHGLWWFDR